MGQHRTRREILTARWEAGVEAARELMRDVLRRPVADPLGADWNELHGAALQLSADIDAVGRRLAELGPGSPAKEETQAGASTETPLGF